LDEGLVAAKARCDREWIAVAQAETAAASYGRPATPGEAATLARRLEAAFGAAGARIMVLHAAGVPAGYFWIEARTGGQWFLLDIWVGPTRRGQGLGRRLLRAAACMAARLGASELRLAVAARNDAARRLFAAEGFRVTDSQMREGRIWLEMGKDLRAEPGVG